MSTLRLRITTQRPASFITKNFQAPGDKHAIIERVIQYLTRVNSGNERAESATAPMAVLIVNQGSEAQATGTVTFSGVGAASDTILINGVTFTAVASGATGNQWNVGASATLSAANLASAINASATALITGVVVASSALGVVTITSIAYGLSGNAITIAKGVDAGSVMTVSGARLTGGTADAGQLNLTF